MASFDAIFGVRMAKAEKAKPKKPSLQKAFDDIFAPDPGVPVEIALKRLMAASTFVRDRTQGYHWNVTGPLFPMLHDMFGAQYNDLADAVDAIAERLRQLDVFVDPRDGVESESAGQDDAQTMVSVLANDHDTLAGLADDCAGVADDAGDAATVDLASKRAVEHRKAAWFLRSTQQNPLSKGGGGPFIGPKGGIWADAQHTVAWKHPGTGQPHLTDDEHLAHRMLNHTDPDERRDYQRIADNTRDHARARDELNEEYDDMERDNEGADDGEYSRPYHSGEMGVNRHMADFHDGVASLKKHGLFNASRNPEPASKVEAPKPAPKVEAPKSAPKSDESKKPPETSHHDLGSHIAAIARLEVGGKYVMPKVAGQKRVSVLKEKSTGFKLMIGTSTYGFTESRYIAQALKDAIRASS